MILRFLGDLPEPKAVETSPDKGSFTKKVYDTLSRKFSRSKLAKEFQVGEEEQGLEESEVIMLPCQHVFFFILDDLESKSFDIAPPVLLTSVFSQWVAYFTL